MTVRLAPKDGGDIDDLVQEGRFTSRSDFIRYAVRLALAHEREANREQSLPETMIEGPGAFPAPGAGRDRHARHRPSKGVNKS